MNREQVDQIIADNQRTEKLLRHTVSQIKQLIANHTDSLIACVTKHNLPEEVENHLVKTAKALNVIPGNYEEGTEKNITALRQSRLVTLTGYGVSVAGKYLTKENILLRKEYIKLEGLSVQEFSQHKISGQKLSQKEEWISLQSELEQMEKETAELLSIMDEGEADSGAGK